MKLLLQKNILSQRLVLFLNNDVAITKNSHALQDTYEIVGREYDVDTTEEKLW